MRKKLNHSSSNSFPVGIYLLMIGVIVTYFILMAGRVDAKHFINVLRINTPLGIAAIAQTLVLLIGGIDLSIGSVITTTNIVACSIMAGDSKKIPITILVCVVIALIIGFVNGIAIAKIKVPPFLATMAMQIILQGAYLLYTGGSPGGKIADSFRIISDGWIGNLIPISIIFWLLVWIIGSMTIKTTIFGRKLFISGDNPIVGRLSGIHTDMYIIGCYMASSLLACLSGLVLSAYVGVASPGLGDDYTLSTIASVVIGGTSFSGGKGSLEGTFAGVMIMVVLQTILSMYGVPSGIRNIFQGFIIFFILLINQNKLNR